MSDEAKYEQRLVVNMPQEGAKKKTEQDANYWRHVVIRQEEKISRYEKEKRKCIGILHDPDLTTKQKLEAAQEFLDLFPKEGGKAVDEAKYEQRFSSTKRRRDAEPDKLQGQTEMPNEAKDTQNLPRTKRRCDAEPDKLQGQTEMPNEAKDTQNLPDEAKLKGIVQRLLGRKKNPYSEAGLLLLFAGLIGDAEFAKNSVIGFLPNWKRILGGETPDDCNNSLTPEYCEVPSLTHLTPETIGAAHHKDEKAFGVKAKVSPDQLMTFIEAYGGEVEFLCFCKAVDSDGNCWLNDAMMRNILIFCPKLRYINLANCGRVTWQPFLAYFIRKCTRLPEIGVGYGLDTQLTIQNLIRTIAPQLQSALGLL